MHEVSHLGDAGHRYHYCSNVLKLEFRLGVGGLEFISGLSSAVKTAKRSL